jgi:NADH-quinone oxidoreductase subunit N
LGVINSAVSAYYYVRIIRVMFTHPATSDEKISGSPAPWLALGVAGAAMVFMGIAPGFVMEAAQEAVKALAI